MRAERDRTDRLQIDLIDVDPDVFEGAGAAPTPGRSRQALKAVGMVTVVAIAAVGWWPRSEPPAWTVFSTPPVPAAGLTEELVFGEPPGPLLAADLAPPPADVKPELGYVFGEPDGTMLTRQWASFRTRSASRSQSPAIAGNADVGDVPAVVRRLRLRRTVTWGPVDGRAWAVSTNRFDDEEAIEFANNVAVIDGQPAVANSYDLGEMEPIGSTAALDCVMLLTSLFKGERQLSPVMPTLVTWSASEGAVSLGSVAAPSDALPLLEFVLNSGQPTTVHGLPAIQIESPILGTVVAWLEDGRLIMVVGELASDAMVALAESVRPATEDEWRVVSRAQLRGPGVGFVPGESVTLYRGVDSDSGDTLAFTAQVVGHELIVCAEQWAGDNLSGTCEGILGVAELPLLTVIELDERRYVLALIDRADAQGSAVRLKLADGWLLLPLEEFGPEIPGWAVASLLPDHYGIIELFVRGQVIAVV